MVRDTQTRHTVTVDVVGEKELKRLQAALQSAGTSIRAINGQTASAAKGARVAALGWQNVGYQVQDFAVQVAGGTTAVRALSQQLPQLLSGFGLLGVVLGTSAAVILPLIGSLVGAGKAAKDASAYFKELQEEASDLADSANAIRLNVTVDTVQAERALAALAESADKARDRAEQVSAVTGSAFTQAIGEAAGLGSSFQGGLALILDWWADRAENAEEAAKSLRLEAKRLRAEVEGNEIIAVNAGPLGEAAQRVTDLQRSLQSLTDTGRVGTAQWDALTGALTDAQRELVLLQRAADAGVTVVADETVKNLAAMSELLGTTAVAVDAVARRLDSLDDGASSLAEAWRDGNRELSDMAQYLSLLKTAGKESADEFQRSADAAARIGELTVEIAAARSISLAAAEKIARQQVETEQSIEREVEAQAKVTALIAAGGKYVKDYNTAAETSVEIAGRLALALAAAANEARGVTLAFSQVASLGGNPFFSQMAQGELRFGNIEGSTTDVEAFTKAVREMLAASRAAADGKSKSKGGVAKVNEQLKLLTQIAADSLSPIQQLQQEIRAAEAALAAFGEKLTPEKLKQVQDGISDMKDELADLQNEVSGVTAVVDVFSNNLNTAFNSLASNAASFGDIFRDLLLGITQDIAAFLINKQVEKFADFLTDILSGAFGGGGGVSDVLSGLFAPTRSLTPVGASAATAGVARSLRASRSATSATSSYIAGNVVTRLASTTTSTGSDESSAPTVIVNNNAPNTQASAAVGSDGRTYVTVEEVRQIVATDVRRGGNAVARSMEDTYRMQRTGR